MLTGYLIKWLLGGRKSIYLLSMAKEIRWPYLIFNKTTDKYKRVSAKDVTSK